MYWLPWALRMHRPSFDLHYAALPSLFDRTPKKYSESLMRNVRAVTDAGVVSQK